MNWNKWLNNGSIKPLKTRKEQAPRLINAAKKQLNDAEKILSTGIYAVARNEAYEAMLKTGMALIMSYGYRPETGSHHLTTYRVVSELLGPKHRGLTKAFNDLRKIRNERLYDAKDYCTKEDAKRAITEYQNLLKLLKKNFKPLKTNKLFLF